MSLRSMRVFQFVDSSLVLTLNSCHKRDLNSDIFWRELSCEFEMTFGLPSSAPSITTTRPSLRLSTFELRWSVLAKRRRSPSDGRTEGKTDGAKKEWGWRAGERGNRLYSTSHWSRTCFLRWRSYLKSLSYATHETHAINFLNDVGLLWFDKLACNNVQKQTWQINSSLWVIESHRLFLVWMFCPLLC